MISSRQPLRVWQAGFLLMLGVMCQLIVGMSKGLEQQEPGISKQDTASSPAVAAVAATTNSPPTVEEARIRARVLHEAFHGVLQVVHRDFFREDQKLTLPSKSLEDVFSDMADTHQIELRWLAVDSKAMSINHEPKSDFERDAVRALSSGDDEFERTIENKYHFAGSIRLSAACLKCHERGRKTNQERKAGLVISMPLMK